MNLKTLLAPFTCAFCGGWIGHQMEWCIHRDGEDEGPLMPLCERCGSNKGPSCEEIWARISRQTPAHLLN